MRILVVCIFLVFSVAACYPALEDHAERNFSTLQQKTVCYQVEQNGTLLGYADKYEWENRTGVKRHYYFVYSPTRELIGHIHWNGETRKYSSDGSTKVLGNFEFARALERIFAVEKVDFYPAGHQDVATSG